MCMRVCVCQQDMVSICMFAIIFFMCEFHLFISPSLRQNAAEQIAYFHCKHQKFITNQNGDQVVLMSCFD